MIGLRQKKKGGALLEVREFVYLDEVSVESLLASVDGEILVQSTQTKSSSLEIGATSSSAIFDHAQFAQNLKGTRGKEIQELRKSVAQSAFARFRSRNHGLFAISMLDARPRRKRDRDRLAGLDGKTLRKLRQGIPLNELKRGDLLEIETNLSAADIFKVRTAMNAVSDVIQANPSFLSIEERDVFKAVRPLTELIDKLNGNAIPVVGVEPGLRVVKVDGTDWLLAGPAIPPGPDEDQILLDSVVQPQWFWGDVGRTLFQNHRFRILCRVISPELSATPSSSYVGAILKTIGDDLAATVDGLGSMFFHAMKTGHQRAKSEQSQSTITSAVVSWFIGEMEKLTGIRVADSDRVNLAFLQGSQIEQMTVESQRALFVTIEEALFFNAPAELAEAIADLRNRARSEFGLWPWSSPSTAGEAKEEEPRQTRHLDVEIVAAYW